MANSARSLGVGSVIADTYTLESMIGRGGMGEVFLASHRRLPGKRVAIKLLHIENASNEVLARFRREAEIASRLDHPNIVGVHDFNVTEDGTPYLVLEYLHGESLAHRLAAGPISVDETRAILRQVGSALARAHRAGIVHRDLKPANIYLVASETGRVCKVLDFGISKIRGSQTVKTQDSVLMGTPQYMAPEQAKGDQDNIDERTDVFALGSIAYEMLAGRPAFAGASIPEVVFKVVYEPAPALASLIAVEPSIVAAIERAMAKRREDRFPTVATFIEALTGAPLSLGGSEPIPAPASVAAASTANAYEATVDSSVSRRVDAHQPTVASNGAIVVPPPRRRRLLIAIGLASALAIGVVVLIAVRVRGTSAPTKPEPIAAAPDAHVALDAAVVATIVQDAMPSQPPPPADASVSKQSPVVAAQAPEEPPLATLRDAQRALDGRDFSTAWALASEVITRSDVKPRQRAIARMIRGVIRCIRDNDELKAADERRAILAYPNLARRVSEACVNAGHPIPGG